MKKDDSHADWSLPPELLDFQSHQVDIWRIKLDILPATVKQLETILSAGEHQRAARFRFEKDKIRYIIAHGCLRDILSRYLQCEPSELAFDTNDYEKPSIRGYELEFNLSHSGDYVLIAVSRKNKVGVDVERMRSDLELEKMTKRFFSASEISELMSLPPEQRDIGFFNCWTRKEAYIKAQGLGLSLPLDSFDVSLLPDEPALLRATRPDADEASRWTLCSLDVDSNHAAALAINTQDLNLRLLDWRSPIQ